MIIVHYENTPIQMYEKNFNSKNWKFSDKNSNIFHISAQNIDCRYSLEQPRRGYNEYLQTMFLSRNKKNNIKNISFFFFFENISVFGCKIFYIFEKACFRNVKVNKL